MTSVQVIGVVLILCTLWRIEREGEGEEQMKISHFLADNTGGK
jgi:hypothetical protein